MRRRNRKHRKSNHQENHIRTIVTKAGNADDMPCGRNLRHFNAKSEPISSSQFNLNVKNKKAPKNHAKRKEKRNGKTQEPITDWLENNLLESNIYVSFPSAKMTSVAYFIPFEIDYYPDFNDNNLNNVMDWNRLIFYGSNSSSMISHYKNKRKNSTQDKSMVLEFPPQLRKSRSSSESSINSDDSFICFEITDDFDNDDEIRYAEDISDKNYPIDTPDIPATTPDPEPTSKKRKRVRFAENSELATVHVIIAWDFAYRAARISPWETAARDANRFKLKIQSVEPIIAPVLDPEHRSKIWYDRMEKFYK